jgi:hypothetical protein
MAETIGRWGADKISNTRPSLSAMRRDYILPDYWRISVRQVTESSKRTAKTRRNSLADT